MKLYHLTCAALLAVAPMAAMAQTTGPSVGADNQKEAFDTKAGSGAKANTSTAPGATGKTVVPGSNSTVAGDKSATEEQKKGAVTGRQ
jgi:hypothetical protein